MTNIDSADFRVERLDGDSDAPVIAVHGQADLHTAPALRDAIAEAIDDGASRLTRPVGRNVCRLHDPGCSSRRQGLRPKGGGIAVVCQSPHIRRIFFEITLLDRVFALHETLDSARSAPSG